MQAHWFMVYSFNRKCGSGILLNWLIAENKSTWLPEAYILSCKVYKPSVSASPGAGEKCGTSGSTPKLTKSVCISSSACKLTLEKHCSNRRYGSIMRWISPINAQTPLECLLQPTSLVPIPGFWFHRSGAESMSLHFKNVPRSAAGGRTRWCRWEWSPTLWTLVLALPPKDLRQVIYLYQL